MKLRTELVKGYENLWGRASLINVEGMYIVNCWFIWELSPKALYCLSYEHGIQILEGCTEVLKEAMA